MLIVKDELKTCAKNVGAQVLGLQTEVDKNVCENDDLKKNVLDNSRVERMGVSTYGSFLAESLAEWSQQVVKLGIKSLNSVHCLCVNTLIIVEEGKFTGRVLQRELSMITHLMTEDNFDKVLRDDGSPLNVTRARVWFEVKSSAHYYLSGQTRHNTSFTTPCIYRITFSTATARWSMPPAWSAAAA